MPRSARGTSRGSARTCAGCQSSPIHEPEVIRERRAPVEVAPGCYRIGPEWLGTLWVAANELSLADELVPFLIARTGRPLDELVHWVKDRRPLVWLSRMLQVVPMSNAAHEELRAAVFAKTDDPEVRARQHMILEWALDAFPEERARLVAETKLGDARAAVRAVLAARKLPLTAEDAARIDGGTSLEVLSRWLDQAVVAASVADALR